MKRIISLLVVFVVLSSTIVPLYAERDLFNAINAEPVSQGEALALQWMVFTYDNFNFGFWGEMLWILEVLHLNTFLWVKYPWTPLPLANPWDRK